MADMSRNCSTTSLVGFSVYQPALGAPLQFVPEMGSKELDDMISLYVPGPASILDKRTAVSLEFFDYTIHTGELFKFFYVYSPVSSSASPASSGMHDSGYGSNFNTSPIMSESQWTHAMPSASVSQANVRKSSKKTASSVSKAQATTDFSHLPGFSIMTKDGQDVTNSVSRGCKTKEQRDHAHLMRIIKACESCRKKKTRCDPSHRKAAKALGASESNGRASKTKKATATKSATVASMKAEPVVTASSFASSATGSFTLDQSFASASDPVTDGWDQFIRYDEEYAETIPQDYDFFYDPAGYLSPSVSNTSSQVPSPLQPTTPPNAATPGQLFVPADAPTFLQPVSRERMDRVDANANANATDTGLPQVQPLDSRAALVHRDITTSDAYGTDSGQKPMLPYLTGDAADVGNNYVDFNLYSPASSFLDEDPGLLQDIAVSSGARYHSSQRSYSSQWLDHCRTGTLADQLLATDSGDDVGDITLTSHGGDRLVGNATAASSHRSGTTTTHSGFATNNLSTADTLFVQESDRLAGNAAITNNAAASNNVTATSSHIASSSSDGDTDANRVEVRRRPGSPTSQKVSTSAEQNSVGEQKPPTDSAAGLQACRDSHAESGTALGQSLARLQSSQISQVSSDTASDQSLAALAICAAILVVSSILSSYVKTSLQRLDGGVQQGACHKTHAALPLALAAAALSSMQTVSQKALGSKQDSYAQNHSRWGTRLSGAVSSWKGMGSSLSSSLAGHLQRGILV